MTTVTKLRKYLKKHKLELVLRCESANDPLSGRNWSPDWSHLPSPSRDIFVKGKVKVRNYDDLPDDQYCGTINFVQYRQWWPKDSHTKASKYSMRHTVLAVPAEEVSYYRKQVLFPREKAIVIGSINKDNSIRTHKSFKKYV